MSICVDYFFNHQSDLSILGQELNAWLGSSLAAQEADPEELFCRFLGMELSLSEHTFENDLELNFEDFRYRLGIRSPLPDADLRSMQIPVMAFIAFSLFRRMGIVGMLVYDVQRLLARYEASVEDGLDELFDLVSQKIVRFPDHLESLSCHLPDHAS